MDLEPLELRRIKADLTMYFKICNNLSANLPFTEEMRVHNTAILLYSAVCK